MNALCTRATRRAIAALLSLTPYFTYAVEPAQPTGIERYLEALSGAENLKCFDVDTSPNPNLIFKSSQNGLGELIYPMVHNNIAEGWSWQPEAAQQGEDYYRFKYLPIGTQIESRGEYTGEDKIGTPELMKIRWQYDYFLAFENLYDFYPRQPEDDDSGFGFKINSVPEPDELAKSSYIFRANFCLTAPPTTESTTFWKATHGKPVDFTLKKRYLLGKLNALSLIDSKSGRVLQTLSPRNLSVQSKSQAQ